MGNNIISRRDFIKGAAASAVGAALFGVAGCGKTEEAEVAQVTEMPKAAEPAKVAEAAKDALYTPGTYSASARGINSDVKVSMTFDTDSIKAVDIDVSGETENIGAAIGDKMKEAIMKGQTWDVDAVSGATVTSDAVRKAAADCISQASGKAIVTEAADKATSNDWLGKEPEIAEADIKETFNCDVLVIGAGSSGAFAAGAAAEEGAKTILIERFDHDHASGIRDTLAACHSTQQKEDGYDVESDTAIRHLCNWSQGYTRPSLARVWAENSGEMADWFTDVLKQGGMEFRHEIDDHTRPSNYEFLEVGHSVQYGPDYYEQLTLDKVLDYAIGKGLEVHYETTMIKLEKKDGRVVGIIAQNAAGNYVRYNAAKGVIMATGGYSNNMDMVRALQPQTVDQIGVNYSKAGAKGDGIKACLWAGAIMDTIHSAMIFDRAAVKPDEHGICGETVPGAWFWMGSQPFLKVNLNGERFMNEAQPYDYVLHQAAYQPYHTYCTVWDEKHPADIERFGTHGCSRLYPHENGAAPVFPMPYVMQMNEGLMADGYIVKADTIEELAEKLNIPVDKFTATVKRYNELTALGEDKDFGKESYRLSTMDTPPFYGARQCGGYFICTMDGIQIDDNMHAVDADYKAIPGLYVIGDCSGNYFSGSYPNLMSGAAAGRSATFGRLAGKYAVKGI